MTRRRPLAAAALVLGLGACTTSSLVSQREAEVAAPVASSPADLARYGQEMAAAYLAIADRNTGVQDAVALSLIGIAAAGVLASVDGASAQTLTQIGVGGIAVGSGARYFDFAGTAKSLVTAAGQHLCISAVASSGAVDDAGTAAIVVRGYDRSRIALRQTLIHQTPSYTDLVSELNQARTAGIRSLAAVPDNRQRVQTAVDACLSA